MPLAADHDRGLRRADRQGRQRGGRLCAAPGLAVQLRPLLRRALGLPDEVDPDRAHARPQGRGDRRRPAHQQEAERADAAHAGRTSTPRSSPSRAVDEEMVSLAGQPGRRRASRTRGSSRTSRNLFDSFVSASVTAIESRDPTTSGHSGARGDCSPSAWPSTWTRSRPGPSATCASPATSSRRSATRACCTTSARWACARRCSSRRKKLYVARDAE